MSEVKHPHDRFVRRSMKRREINIPLFRRHIPPEVLRCLDLETAQLEPASYIDEKFRETQADLVFSMKHRDTGEPVSVYLLFEHKSGPDPDLPWALLSRSMRIMGAERDKSGKTPLVIPLVLYHGKTPWKGPWDMRDLVKAAPELHRFAPVMEMIMVDLSHIPDEALEDEAWLTVFHLVLKHIYRGDLIHVLIRLAPEILKIQSRKSGLAFMHEVYQYIFKATHHINTQEILGIAVQLLPEEVSKDMISIADALRAEGREEVREEARKVLEEARKVREEVREEGREEGREENRRQMAKKLFALDLPIEILEAVTEMSREEIYKINGKPN